jgi:hypothetical protein
VLLKLETKKRKLKSTLDRIRETLQAKKNGNAQNNDEEVLMEVFN